MSESHNGALDAGHLFTFFWQPKSLPAGEDLPPSVLFVGLFPAV
jgi:hypothetical protein